MGLQEINAPMNEFITWKRALETTSQSNELKLAMAIKMDELMDVCHTIVKTFLKETKELYEREKKK